MEYLSNIELYYTPFVQNDAIALIDGSEFKHITRVMRHIAGDEIYFTNGLGSIYRGRIDTIQKDNLNVKVKEVKRYQNKFSNIVFCLPKLKNPDRFEYALEKCAELGITRFIVFSSERTFVKGDKPERWNNILLSAMKQSLRSFIPAVENVCSYKQLAALGANFILFDQSTPASFKNFIQEKDKTYYLMFGPEGGLTPNEIELLSNKEMYALAPNRLRTETAAVTAASLISTSDSHLCI